jgi:hypothetical protein
MSVALAAVPAVRDAHALNFAVRCALHGATAETLSRAAQLAGAAAARFIALATTRPVTAAPTQSPALEAARRLVHSACLVSPRAARDLFAAAVGPALATAARGEVPRETPPAWTLLLQVIDGGSGGGAAEPATIAARAELRGELGEFLRSHEAFTSGGSAAADRGLLACCEALQLPLVAGLLHVRRALAQLEAMSVAPQLKSALAGALLQLLEPEKHEAAAAAAALRGAPAAASAATALLSSGVALDDAALRLRRQLLLAARAFRAADALHLSVACYRALHRLDSHTTVSVVS